MHPLLLTTLLLQRKRSLRSCSRLQEDGGGLGWCVGLGACLAYDQLCPQSDRGKAFPGEEPSERIGNGGKLHYGFACRWKVVDQRGILHLP